MTCKTNLDVIAKIVGLDTSHKLKVEIEFSISF